MLIFPKHCALYLTPWLVHFSLNLSHLLHVKHWQYSHWNVLVIDVCSAVNLSYRVFSLTWPAFMEIYWNKRKRLHKKRVQLPQDWFGTPTWPPFYCFGTPIWTPWHHVKTLYKTQAKWGQARLVPARALSFSFSQQPPCDTKRLLWRRERKESK